MDPNGDNRAAIITRYQELVRHSADVITVVDGRGDIEYQSPSVERVLGYGTAELEGESVFDYLHPDDRPLIQERLREAIEDPEAAVAETEYRFRHADGSWVWLASTATEYPASGETTFVVNSRDVTERHESHLALERERALYESVVEGVNDAIAIVRDGRFVFANARCHELLGYDSGELIGTARHAVIDPADQEMVARRGRQRLDPEQPDPPTRYEVNLRTTSGDRVIGEVNVEPITYESDPATLVVIRDVTERRRYEDLLKSRNEELEALNRVVRHDVRNDMAVIMGWTELLDEHVDEEGRELLEKVLTSGRHVVELTEIARDFVETLTSGAEPDLRRIALASTLETEIDLGREFYPDATFTVEGSLPDVEVRATEMLSSVFSNLLRNAVQHNPSASPRVNVTALVEGRSVVVRVADDGPGVPEAAKDRIFGKGEKGLDSDGTGIGLYLVRSLVEQYGGEVWVEDNVLRGAVFVVQLPVAD